MKPRDSLGRRILQAYLLFALVSSLLFFGIAIFAVEGIETHLVDDRLTEVAEWASPRHAGGLPVAMPAGLTYHHGDAIPASLRGLPDGVWETGVDGVNLHVLKGRDTLGPFVVVDHESDYEHVELVVYSMFAAGFLGMLALSLFLGRFIARRLVGPMTELVQAVEGDKLELPLVTRADELGLLARAFAARTAALRVVLERERSFTGDVSHELRTPLTVIAGAAEILLDQHRANTAVSVPAQRILRAANEAASSASVLLMLARSPERIVRNSTDIGRLAVDEVARYQGLVAGRPLTLRLESGPGFNVDAAPELCAAAIGNLIRNACQYTHSGEVVVSLRGSEVVVEDSGPGMSPTADRSGIGLGLVRRICDHLGSALRLEARETGGTRATIDFTPILTPI